MRFQVVMSWFLLAAIVAAMFNITWGLVFWFVSLVFLVIPQWSKSATKLWLITVILSALALVIHVPALGLSPITRLVVISSLWSLLYMVSVLWYSKAASRKDTL